MPLASMVIYAKSSDGKKTPLKLTTRQYKNTIFQLEVKGDKSIQKIVKSLLKCQQENKFSWMLA
jgi:hypothetical protein